MFGKMKNLYTQFIEQESSSSILLLIFTTIAMILANTPLASQYENVLNFHIAIGFGDLALSKTVLHWINDGLMAIFFLVVGMEIKRELVRGELSSLKKAILPVGAAIGGMIVPAVIYVMFNYGLVGIHGWAIPMSTDIAFGLGALTLLGSKKAPKQLVIFLTALAIIDDLGAVLVIAIFYTANISLSALIIALAIFLILVLANRLGINYLSVFLILGLFLWFFLLKSGIHATIAGVLLGMTIPTTARKKEEITMLNRLEHMLLPWTNFLIMPLFALANAGIHIELDQLKNIITNPISIGIILGLFIGKQLGIFGASKLMIKSNITDLPSSITSKQLYGASIIGGIGFTMSMFIATLAFNDQRLLEIAKISIIMASILSAIVGLLVLSLNKQQVTLQSEI